MIRLIYNQYTDPNPARNSELREVEGLNKSNLAFNEIIALDGRPSFNDIFAKVNEITGADDLNIIANSDIYFDDTLPLATGLTRDACYALTRWDRFADGRLSFYNHIDSQDVWMFRGKIRPMNAVCAIENPRPFGPGERGCDNRLAHLIEKAGYRVSNPSLSVRAIHLHLTGIRHYGYNVEIHPPYSLLTPVSLGQLRAPMYTMADRPGWNRVA
jgi:hypothetical protein